MSREQALIDLLKRTYSQLAAEVHSIGGVEDTEYRFVLSENLLGFRADIDGLLVKLHG